MALLGPEGMKLKFGMVDARIAAASAIPAGKSKKDLLENIVLSGLGDTYAKLTATLAEAGGVTDEKELYTNEATLAKCMALLSRQLFDLLPAGTPRFDRQPEMMSRMVFAFLIDEAHELAAKPAAASAVWVPLVCDGALGRRGAAPTPLLPALHVVFAPFNPKEPLADAVRNAGRSVLTPRQASDADGGVRIMPALEIVAGDADEPGEVWDTQYLLESLTSTSASGMKRRADVVAAVIPDANGSMSSRCSAARVLCVVDGHSSQARRYLPALMLVEKFEREAKALFPAGVEASVSVHPDALAASMAELMQFDGRQQNQMLDTVASTLAAKCAMLVRTRPELVRDHVLRVKLASLDDTALVVTGVVRRGSVVVASPGGRVDALRQQLPGRAAARQKLPSNLMQAATQLAAPAGSPLAWAKQHLGADDAATVEVHNIAELERWEAADASNWRKKASFVPDVWGWQCPMHLAPSYLEWAEPGKDVTVASRCFCPSFAVLPPGVVSVAEARMLKPEASCSVPAADGANVLVSLCMRPAVGGNVGCVVGDCAQPPFSHCFSTARTGNNSGRHLAAWEVSCACGSAEAAAACAAFAKRKFVTSWTAKSTPPMSTTRAHGAALPLYVANSLVAQGVVLPTTRAELVQLAAEHYDLGEKMASAATWRACGGVDAAVAGEAAAGGVAGGGVRRLLTLGGDPRPSTKPATQAAFEHLLAAAIGGASSDA